MLLEILLGLLSIAFFYFLLKKDPESILGIYSQPGKWFFLKKAVFILFLTLRKYQMSRLKKRQEMEGVELGADAGYGFKSRNTVDDMECVQKLLNDPMAIDCMYFNGLNANGDYILLRIARRHNRIAEIWLSINIIDVGFFQSPIHPDTTLYNTSDDSYDAGGLKFEPLEPMKRWKVTFNGLLRKGFCNTWSPDKEDEEMVHVRFSFIWNAFTDPFDFDTDIHSNCIASAVAKEKWSKEYFDRLKKSHQTHYEQWGQLFGIVQVDGNDDKYFNDLRGYRDHSFGVRDWFSFHRYAINFAYLEDGSVFHVDSISMPETLSLLQCGYMSRPNATMIPVSWTDMDMIELGENQNPPLNYKFKFMADGKLYHVEVKTHTVIKYYLHDDWRSVIFEQVSDYVVNGIKGYGIFEFVYRNPRCTPIHQEISLPLLKELDISHGCSNSLWLSFAHPECTSSQLVGGKGCQLALLSQLQSHEEDFLIPFGFCLTISAFDQQLQENISLLKSISHLEEVSCSSADVSQLQLECDVVTNEFLKVPICRKVEEAIDEGLNQIFNEEKNKSLSFAVRSSAAGEDGSEMSAAGQMETVLGVSGFEKIKDAVRLCWSSQFSFAAIMYRRQHGQLIKSSAGVVIQEMVPAKAAGVLFTRHPVTGNPRQMVLDANFGLGQSVVSGEAEPDHVTISRSWKDEITIATRHIGSKKRQMKLISSGGVEHIDVSNSDNSECCLEDDVILKLAKIGIELEKRFGNPRDIEFAIDNDNKIYLLQARPITTLDVDTDDWMILHEFDSALAHNRELLTTANIQEMMPGAMTPLTIQCFSLLIDNAYQNLLVKIGIMPNSHYPRKLFPIICNQGFVNIHFSMGLYEGNCAIAQKAMCELALLGEVLHDFTIDELRSYQGQFSRWKRIFNAFRFLLVMYKGSKKTAYWQEFLQSYNIANKDHKSTQELYNEITKELPCLEKIWFDHLVNSSSSAVWTNAMMSIVTQNQLVWKTEHYSDVAMLLSKCDDVFSADVPSAVQKLAESLRQKEDVDKFIHLSPEKAFEWLSSELSGDTGKEFKNFLSKHGHRCIREAEFREKSWKSEPTKVVKVLQSTVKALSLNNGFRKTTSKEITDLSQIKAKLNFSGRLALAYVLPKARQGVGGREMFKSLSISMVEVFKQAYLKLADMMVKECRLPDKDLIFFLTHREIGILLQTRSAKLITRSQKRRQMFPIQMSLRFQRINYGHPKPIINVEVENSAITVTTFKVLGLPVSRGTTKGIARVVTSLEMAASIQMGDILIVAYTDIGWSPYFPLISGLVTEIGGLVSHGAVVAREYGLPCVVNVPNATQIFNSGDTIILNGTLGTVEKVTAE